MPLPFLRPEDEVVPEEAEVRVSSPLLARRGDRRPLVMEGAEPRKEADAPAPVPGAQAEVEVLYVEGERDVERSELAPDGRPHGHRRARDPADVRGRSRVERLQPPPRREAPEKGREGARLGEEPGEVRLAAPAPLGRAVREAERRAGDSEGRRRRRTPPPTRARLSGSTVASLLRRTRRSPVASATPRFTAREKPVVASFLRTRTPGRPESVSAVPSRLPSSTTMTSSSVPAGSADPSTASTHATVSSFVSSVGTTTEIRMGFTMLRRGVYGRDPSSPQRLAGRADRHARRGTAAPRPRPSGLSPATRRPRPPRPPAGRGDLRPSAATLSAIAPCANAMTGTPAARHSLSVSPNVSGQMERRRATSTRLVPEEPRRALRPGSAPRRAPRAAAPREAAPDRRSRGSTSGRSSTRLRARAGAAPRRRALPCAAGRRRRRRRGGTARQPCRRRALSGTPSRPCRPGTAARSPARAPASHPGRAPRAGAAGTPTGRRRRRPIRRSAPACRPPFLDETRREAPRRREAGPAPLRVARVAAEAARAAPRRGSAADRRGRNRGARRRASAPDRATARSASGGQPEAPSKFTICAPTSRAASRTDLHRAVRRLATDRPPGRHGPSRARSRSSPCVVRSVHQPASGERSAVGPQSASSASRARELHRHPAAPRGERRREDVEDRDAGSRRHLASLRGRHRPLAPAGSRSARRRSASRSAKPRSPSARKRSHARRAALTAGPSRRRPRRRSPRSAPPRPRASAPAAARVATRRSSPAEPRAARSPPAGRPASPAGKNAPQLSSKRSGSAPSPARDDGDAVRHRLVDDDAVRLEADRRDEKDVHLREDAALLPFGEPPLDPDVRAAPSARASARRTPGPRRDRPRAGAAPPRAGTPQNASTATCAPLCGISAPTKPNRRGSRGTRPLRRPLGHRVRDAVRHDLDRGRPGKPARLAPAPHEEPRARDVPVRLQGPAHQARPERVEGRVQERRRGKTRQRPAARALHRRGPGADARRPRGGGSPARRAATSPGAGRRPARRAVGRGPGASPRAPRGGGRAGGRAASRRGSGRSRPRRPGRGARCARAGPAGGSR